MALAAEDADTANACRRRKPRIPDPPCRSLGATLVRTQSVASLPINIVSGCPPNMDSGSNMTRLRSKLWGPADTSRLDLLITCSRVICTCPSCLTTTGRRVLSQTYVVFSSIHFPFTLSQASHFCNVGRVSRVPVKKSPRAVSFRPRVVLASLQIFQVLLSPQF
ncbi:hypothetical protein BX600DRAFT_233090 [Xylariales sp. PMI_506]|nr:hypothetical protein BX600DRAFT_233090 [Xylariales sp. PMI_506]